MPTPTDDDASLDRMESVDFHPTILLDDNALRALNVHHRYRPARRAHLLDPKRRGGGDMSTEPRLTETYFKAVRPDGTDFHSGTVRWLPPVGESLPDDGLVVTHPTSRKKKPRRAKPASFYLSVATVPTDCTGMEWPCRLARAERTHAAVWTPDADRLPHKRASWQWRVVEELDPTLALGPQGAEVAAIIDRANRLTEDEAEALDAARATARAAAWAAAWAAVRAAAWAAARAAVRAAVREAARDARAAVRDAARDAAWDAARATAWEAAIATLTRDLISEADYQLLAGPWNKVIGEQT